MVRDIAHIVADMLQAIEWIGEFVDGHNETSLMEDPRSYLAVQRALEIISEASRGIPEETQRLHPSVRWPQLRAFGNVMRHEYDGIAPDLIWSVIVDELPTLKAAPLSLREART